MKNEKKKNKNNIIVYFIGLFVPILALIVIIFNIYKDNKFINSENTLKTIGIVSRFNSENNTAYITFKDRKGIEYSGLKTFNSAVNINLIFYSFDLSKDTVEVYYDKTNPNDFIIIDNTSNIVGIIVSLMFIILIIYGFIYNNKKNKSGENLIKIGHLVNGSIISINQEVKSQTKKIYYCLLVSYIYEGIYYETKRLLKFDPSNIINKYGIKTIDVYIENNNPKNSYIDISKLEKYKKKEKEEKRKLYEKNK